MYMAKKTTFTGRPADELHKALADKREALRAYRFAGAGSRSRNVKEGKTMRKDIARVLTALNAPAPKVAKAAKTK